MKKHPLVFALAGLVLGLLFAGATPSQAEPAAACRAWEISIWSPQEAGCKYKGAAPYTHRDEWCKAPEGAEIVGGLESALKLYIKRCAD